MFRIPQIKLSHQGIILVSVPLFFEIVFVLTLLSLLGRVEFEARRAEHQRNVVIQTDKMVNLFYQCGVALASYDATKNPFFKAAYDKTAAEILHQQLVLKRLAENDSSALSSLDTVTQNTNKALAALGSFEEKIDRGEKLFADGAGSVEGLKKVSDDFAFSLDGVRSQQKNEDLREPAIQAGLEHAVETCLFAGVCFNVVLAVFLARAFHRLTASRLNVLVENTHRLAASKPLEQKLDGDDEIAYLDETFRAMAVSLKEAAQHKQQVLEMVSHDLRSPLTSAQLSLELIGASQHLPEQQRGEINGVRRSIKSCVRLINDLLDIEKMQAGKFELKPAVVNLEVIVENCIDTVKGLAQGKNVSIAVGETDIDVLADGDRLSQVIINLLANAIKFSPEGSEVRINSQVTPESVTVSIADEGLGISAELQSTIFDRFTQIESKENHGGSGLGLAICKAIVEQHGGKIWVESTAGKGSTFLFEIPNLQRLIDAQEPAVAATPVTETASGTAS